LFSETKKRPGTTGTLFFCPMGKSRLKHVLIIIGLVVILYLNSLGINFFWDDTALVLDNTLIHNPAHLGRIFFSYLSVHSRNFYRPLQNLSYAIDFFFYKFDYRGYHVTNILLHTVAALLAYFLILGLTQRDTLSLVSVLLYLSSPLWVESVAYISGRADMLMAIFIYSSFIAFSKERIVWSVIFYLLALLSKEASLVYPLLVFFYMALFSQRNKPKIIGLATFCALAALYGYFRLVFFPPAASSLLYPGMMRLFIFLKVTAKYLVMIFLPLNQHMSHFIRLPDSFLRWDVLSSVVILWLTFYLFIRCLKQTRVVSFFIGWFFIMLLAYGGILPINALFAEHFAYIASLGIFAAWAYFLLRLQRAGKAVFCLQLLFFCFATLRYNLLWHDEAAFYKRIIGLSPRSLDASNNLGVAYLKQGNFPEAEKLFRRAISLEPNASEALINLSRLYYLQGDYRRATGLLEEALKKEPENYLALNYLATVYFKRGNHELAERYYQASLKANPLLAGPWADLYLFYRLNNRQEDAAVVEKELFKLDPQALTRLYFQEAGRLFQETKYDDSLVVIAKGLNIESRSSSLYNLRGCVLKAKGDLVGALESLKEAWAIAPDDWQVNNNLGNLFAQLGDYRNAENFYRRAVRLNRDFADGYFNLGLVYFQQKKFPEAEQYLRRAVTLAGRHQLAEEYLRKISQTK
jgi:Flp pilus assembly protein TadD